MRQPTGEVLLYQDQRGGPHREVAERKRFFFLPLTLAKDVVTLGDGEVVTLKTATLRNRTTDSGADRFQKKKTYLNVRGENQRLFNAGCTLAQILNQ